MAGVESRDFDSPDETRTPEKTQVDVVPMGVTTAARMTFEPGWRWSECVKPVAGTDSCQARHVGVVHAGRLAVRHEDGTKVEIGPGAGVRHRARPRRVGGRRRAVRRIRVRVASGGGIREGLNRASRCPEAGLTVATGDEGRNCCFSTNSSPEASFGRPLVRRPSALVSPQPITIGLANSACASCVRRDGMPPRPPVPRTRPTTRLKPCKMPAQRCAQSVWMYQWVGRSLRGWGGDRSEPSCEVRCVRPRRATAAAARRTLDA